MLCTITKEEWTNMYNVCWKDGKSLVKDQTKTEYHNNYCDFMYDMDNAYNCEHCPLNRGTDCTGNCWVIAHNNRTN